MIPPEMGGGAAAPRSGVPSPVAPVGVVLHKTYTALVKGDADLVGHVAYAFYKRDKLKFCDGVKSNKGRSATTEEIDAFIQVSNIDTRLDSYRSEAEKLLARVTELQLEDAVEEIQRDSNAKLARKLAEAKSWGRVCQEAIVGSFIVTALWALLGWCIYFSKANSIEQVAKDVFHVDIQPPQKSPEQVASSPEQGNSSKH